jgi:hypothetical protein
MQPDKNLGQIAYEAYGEAVGHKNYQGNPMPNWYALPAAINQAWRAAAWAVVIENADRERVAAQETEDAH